MGDNRDCRGGAEYCGTWAVERRGGKRRGKLVLGDWVVVQGWEHTISPEERKWLFLGVGVSGWRVEHTLVGGEIMDWIGLDWNGMDRNALHHALGFMEEVLGVDFDGGYVQ